MAFKETEPVHGMDLTSVIKIPKDPFTNSLRKAKALDYAAVTANITRNISQFADVPFLSSIASSSLVIFPMVKSAKLNKEICMQLVERIHQLHCAVITICIATKCILSMEMLGTIANFAEHVHLFITLQKIRGCLRSQQELGKIRRLFKQSEIKDQLRNCDAGLQTALDTLNVQSGIILAKAVVDMEANAEKRHHELLSLLGNQSEDSASEYSIPLSGSFGNYSSREKELQEVVSTLLLESARVVILGAGGMGKTALATTALHHPSIISKYSQNRHFISCESATTAIQLINAVGTHLELQVKQSTQLASLIIGHFKKCDAALLCLDNLETTWERPEAKNAVEEFLSLLSDVPCLALLITMRGTERPAKVKWTRPFLPPLTPLSPLASRQIFTDIADDTTAVEEPGFQELLEYTGNLPLAINLIASVASFEGYTNTLARLKAESTALISEGCDKRSNLEKSIMVSLTSPRMMSAPNAKQLLSLLSVLPDGLSEFTLMSGNINIPSILNSRSVLIRNSLAYIDSEGRLRALAPIREVIQTSSPPGTSLTEPLRKYWLDFLILWQSQQWMSPGEMIPELTSNIGNIESLVTHGLGNDWGKSPQLFHCMNILNSFSVTMLGEQSSLMQLASKYIKSLEDSWIKWRYIGEILRGNGPPLLPSDTDTLIQEGLQYFDKEHDDTNQASNMEKAQEFINLAIQLISANHTLELLATTPTFLRFRAASIFRIAADIQSDLGKHHAAKHFSREGQRIARVTGDILGEMDCLCHEIIAFVDLNDLKPALELCAIAEELVQNNSLQNSSLEMLLLDLKAGIAFDKMLQHDPPEDCPSEEVKVPHMGFSCNG
ncbi:hypothetical protein C8R44DRAFT_923114 [Mycena epipterygia]|nr:hypothetical protein C8R44DRAFT_923114 [Mycena epipterygia]